MSALANEHTLAHKMARNPDIVDMCLVCKINLWRPDGRPADMAMPCGVHHCPFERQPQILTDRDAALVSALVTA